MKYIFVDENNDMYKQAVALRYSTFFKPLNLKIDKVYDDLEQESIHLVCNQNEKVLGYGRLTISNDKVGLISQIVVNEDYQKMGIGQELIRRLIKFSKENKCNSIALNSKIEAVEFYSKLGFCKVGDIFSSKKTGLPHIKMIKIL